MQVKIQQVNREEFFDTIYSVQYQNSDILEAMQLGYKSVQDAYEASELPWARFYTIYNNKDVLGTILEQRDGVLVFYTTTKLHGSNIRSFVKELKKLVNDVTSCRDVVYTVVLDWHKDGQKLLRTVGFRQYKIYNNKSIWVYEYGKSKKNI